MNRRGFLKAAGLGVGAGAAVMCRVPEAEASLTTQVYDLVIQPKDILKDPMVGPVFDMNDDVSGLSCLFTKQLLLDYADKHGLSHDEAVSMLQWGLRQPAVIGLILAKKVVAVVFQDGELADQIARNKVFKEMLTRYGVLLDSSGPNPLGQYWRLKA